MTQKDSDAGNRTRGKHVRDAYVTNYTTSEFDNNTVNIPLSDNGFWILLQFAVRGGAMFHIGISEKTDVNK